MAVKYEVTYSTEYNEYITEYTVLKTTKRWWGFWSEEYVIVYQLKSYFRCFYSDGKVVDEALHSAICNYKIACEIKECLSI